MKGFTLIETLVALTILTVALIPAFQVASSAIALSGSIRNSLIAAHMAQEGVEVVRAIRDGNWFASQPYDTGLNCGSARVDYNSDVPLTCTPPCDDSGDCVVEVPVPLKIDTASGLYQYNTGADSLFNRTISIAPISDHELKVVSTVNWSEQTGPKSFSVEYHLFDWLQ